MSVRSYDPSKVTITFKNTKVVGYMDTPFVEFERLEPDPGPITMSLQWTATLDDKMDWHSHAGEIEMGIGAKYHRRMEGRAARERQVRRWAGL